MTVSSPVASRSCTSSSHCSQAWKPTSSACSCREAVRPPRHAAAAAPPASRAKSGPCSLGERAPGREVLAACSPRSLAPASGTARPPSRPRRTSPAAPRRLSRHASSRSTSRLARAARPAARSSALVASVVDPQVERVAEPSRRREVRAGLLRQRGRDGVQRVDQQEPAAEPLGPLAQPTSGRRGHRSPSCAAERAAYSCTVQPQRCCSGSQQRPGETISRRSAPSAVAQQVVAEREVVRDHVVERAPGAVLAVDRAGRSPVPPSRPRDHGRARSSRSSGGVPISSRSRVDGLVAATAEARSSASSQSCWMPHASTRRHGLTVPAAVVSPCVSGTGSGTRHRRWT